MKLCPHGNAHAHAFQTVLQDATNIPDMFVGIMRCDA